MQGSFDSCRHPGREPLRIRHPSRPVEQRIDEIENRRLACGNSWSGAIVPPSGIGLPQFAEHPRLPPRRKAIRSIA